ncbi:hypothetical protein BH10BAC5_BH10BAC5_08600 [soil metagenome]
MEISYDSSGTFPMLAKTHQGLEEVLMKELDDIGAVDIKKLYRAVSFTGDKRMMYKSNLHLRTCLRILKPIYKFTARNENELYEGIQEIDWSLLMDLEGTLALDCVISSDRFFQHSKYVSLKAKDAIVDQFNQKRGSRPDVNTIDPDLRINLLVYEDEITVSLDSSGSSLHKRGYRLDANEAPLNETLAAGMVLLSGWNRDCDFLDPMCGSGTIPIEAFFYASNCPSNIGRNFGFTLWKDFDNKLWLDVRNEAYKNIKTFEHNIIGNDLSGKNISICKVNVNRIDLPAHIKRCLQFDDKNFFDSEEHAEKLFIITNPPYGERLKDFSGNASRSENTRRDFRKDLQEKDNKYGNKGRFREGKFINGKFVKNPPKEAEKIPEKTYSSSNDPETDEEALKEFYKKIGDTLKHKYPNTTAWILSSSIEGVNSIRLSTSRKIKLFNGALQCLFSKFIMFKGTLPTKAPDFGN